MPKRKKTEQELYDREDLNAIYTCALRYAFGRVTYMPGLVTDYIRRHADTVTDKELGIMIRDLQEEIETAERVGDKHYGMDCDKRTWLDFYSWLLEEKARREEKPCSGETF